MSYLTIKDRATEEFVEKKSIFIGHAARVYSEEEAKEFVREIKDIHKEATHNVYAYVIGQNMGIQRYSDDGEPQGTAGIPVLEVIKKNKITDVAIVVTRYFGGILLGGGGLVRAYSHGAAIAIDKAGIVEKVEGLALNIIINYDLLGKVQYLCSEKGWHLENIEYTDKVKLTTFAEVDKVENIKDTIREITSGKVEYQEEKKKYYFKMENRLYEDNKES